MKPQVRCFRVPPVLLTGGGCSDAAGEEAGRLGARRVLVVTDPVMSRSGAVDRVVGNLAGLSY